MCVLVVRKWMAKLVRGFGGGWWGSGGGHVILVSNHERQVQVLVASCVCEKPEKAEVKAIKCAKCCKTAHNRQRRQQFRQRLDASACKRGEETLFIGQRERVQRRSAETAKVTRRRDEKMPAQLRGGCGSSMGLFLPSLLSGGDGGRR